MSLKIAIKKLHPGASVPKYAHGPEEDAGLDLTSVEDVALDPFRPTLVPTGLSIALPPGYEAQVRPRSGFSLKGVLVANSPGTIDPGYRGEIKVILLNTGAQTYYVKAGDRIAQMIIAKYEAVEFVEGELSETERGDGGFGSSGV